MTKELDTLANKITDALLTTALGTGTRLAVMQAQDPRNPAGHEYNLGGRGRASIKKEVLRVLKANILNVYLQPTE